MCIIFLEKKNEKWSTYINYVSLIMSYWRVIEVPNKSANVNNLTIIFFFLIYKYQKWGIKNINNKCVLRVIVISMDKIIGYFISETIFFFKKSI